MLSRSPRNTYNITCGISRRIRRNSCNGNSPLTNQDGMATLESICLLIIFVVLFAFTLGSFGIIHTGILDSIAARTYAFETIRHRTNLVYLRDRVGTIDNYQAKQFRVHAILSEKAVDSPSEQFYATERPISMGLESPVKNRDQTDVHLTQVYSQDVADGVRNIKVETNPVWLLVQYGVCLNASCGDRQ